LRDFHRQAAGIGGPGSLSLQKERLTTRKELRPMNRVVLLWVAAVAALAFGASATATTQLKSRAYALSAAHILESGATGILRYVEQHI
jgi:hypothetical protein